MKYEISHVEPDLLDFIIQKRLYLPIIKFVEVDLRSSVNSDQDVVANVYRPIAELHELLKLNWLKKGQPGYIDLMFSSFCNPDLADDLRLEIVEELKELSKKYGGLNYD